MNSKSIDSHYSCNQINEVCNPKVILASVSFWCYNSEMALLKNSAAILMPCFSNRVLGLKQDYVYLLLDVLSLRVLLTLLSAIKYNINLENLLKKKLIWKKKMSRMR